MKVCKFCQKQYNTTGKYYCSKSCRAQDTGVGHGKKTGKFIDCNTCKKPIWRKGYQLKKSKVFFCSIKCHAVYKKTLDYSWCSGENQWNWKGGISLLNKQLRKTVEYEEWRKAVFERDNYSCQNCEVTGGYLEADHIKPFSLFPELRTDINNGRTLCKPCHNLIGWKGSHVMKGNV